MILLYLFCVINAKNISHELFIIKRASENEKMNLNGVKKKQKEHLQMKILFAYPSFFECFTTS